MGSTALSKLTVRQAVPAAWFRGLEVEEKMVARGAAANLDSRKAVLIGVWAAAQFGMWFARPQRFHVQFALPSGHLPAKASWPQRTEYRAVKIAEDDIAELDGVRATHPLRTFVDFCRMGDNVNAMLAVAWLLRHGVARERMLRFLDGFDGPIRPERLDSARRLVEHAPELATFGYNLAYALLADAAIPLTTRCALEEMGGAELLAGEDLIIAVDENPLDRAAATRRRDRWLAARGYRKLYFASEDIQQEQRQFVDDVLGYRHLRRRDLRF